MLNTFFSSKSHFIAVLTSFFTKFGKTKRILKQQAMNQVSLQSSPGFILQHLEYFTFISSQLALIKGIANRVPSEGILQQLVNEAAGTCDRNSSSIVKVKRSQVTSEIKQAAARRNLSLSALKSAVANAMYSLNPQEVEQATLVSILLSKYRGMERSGIEKAVGAVAKQLDTLQDPKYSAAVEALGLNRLVDRLKADNEEVRALFESRRSLQIARGKSTAAALRRQLNQQYSLLCDYVLVMARIGVHDAYPQALRAINEVRREYTTLQRRRAGTAKEADRVIPLDMATE